MPFLDELASGIAPASTPDIARFVDLSGGNTVAAMIVAFHALAFFLEAPLLAWSERVSPRWFSAGSLLVVALGCLGAAAAGQGWGLYVALSVYGTASGCALAQAEGMLVSATPAQRERTLARLGLAANLGDLSVPLLLVVLSWLSLGWRAGFVASAVVALGLALVHACAPSLDRAPRGGDGDEGGDDEGPEPSFREAFTTTVRNRPLLAWSLAAALTNLLDEVLVAFGALHLAARGASSMLRAGAIAGWVVGAIVGLFVLERIAERFAPRRLLLGASLLSAVGVLGFALAPTAPLAAAAFVLVGMTASTLHPLAKAQAYAALPSRPALVNAAASVLLPLDMLAPVVLGLAATHGGTSAAILGLLVAPVGVGLAASRLRGTATAPPS